MKSPYVYRLKKLLTLGILRQDMRILVVCGGNTDKNAMLEAGFKNVVVTNMAKKECFEPFEPYAYEEQDVENLTYCDEAFDFCIAHDGLHHCNSPHRAMLEMYRVSKLGFMAFEPRDNLMVAFGSRFGFGQEYEIAAVMGHQYKGGGWMNTPIPNYVYRFNPREIMKTFSTASPFALPRFMFFNNIQVSWGRYRSMRNKRKLICLLLAYPIYRAISFIIPALCTNLAFVVLKPRIPEDLHPWVKHDDGRLVPNIDWMQGGGIVNHDAKSRR